MMAKVGSEPFSFYKEHPKTCAPDDFWGQVKRTVNGKPVSDEQIKMIVDAICDGLNIEPSDYILDLCCGNGALSDIIFDRCQGGLGVDFSEKLIETAHLYFQKPPNRIYQMDDVVEYIKKDKYPEKYTKLLCYGSFAYLEAHRAEELLQQCFQKYMNASRMFIGNCPDKSKIDAFFHADQRVEGIEIEPDSAIGIWRTREEFTAIADRAGWLATFTTMPGSFYASGYRYDVILERKYCQTDGISPDEVT